MSEKLTRVSSAAAVDGDLTDWERLRGMTDEELQAAIADDPDSRLGPDGAVAPVRGLVFRDSQARWRWRLIAPDGKAIADSPTSYADRSEVDRAIQALRDAIVAGQAKAA